MRSFAIAALVGSASAAPSVIFGKSLVNGVVVHDAPACTITADGQTLVMWRNDIHPSFKCTKNAGGTACSCSSTHPTHHTGGCKEFDGPNQTHQTGGDCTDTGINTVHGSWSTWTAQGSCSASCGDGLQTYTRTCDGIVNGGNDCSGLDGGSATKTENCKIKECPVDGGWSTYGGWSTCSASCGPGTKSQTRTCDNPAPAHLGADCTADGSTDTNTASCNEGACVTYSWSKTAATCPTACGNAASNPADSYDCVGSDGSTGNAASKCGATPSTTTSCAATAGCNSCTTYTATRALHLGSQVEMSAGGITYGQGGTTQAACLAACQSTAACKQAVWYNNHCYPMNAASKVDTDGNNAGFTSYQCSSTAGRQCTTKTSTRSKYLGSHVEISADGIAYGQGGVTLEQCTSACEKTAACKQAVWYNNHCYPMNEASDMVEAGSNAGFTSVHCGAPTAPVKHAWQLQRFEYGKSVGHGSHNAAHSAESSYCAQRGGRLPNYNELCPNYNQNGPTSPKLGCENSHSWMPYSTNSNNWMYVGCDGTGGHHMCKDHVAHHGNPGWSSGDQYGIKLDCMLYKPVQTVLAIQRFHYGKSSGHANHVQAHGGENAFCQRRGGRLPNYNELCPNYNQNVATSPALGCENSHSWMPYSANSNNWMYVGCAGTGHHECKDHVAHHGNPGWSSGDQYGDKLDCMVPQPVWDTSGSVKGGSWYTHVTGKTQAQARKLCVDDNQCAGMFESNPNQWHLFSAGTGDYYSCCAAGCRATYGLSAGYCATNVQTVAKAWPIWGTSNTATGGSWYTHFTGKTQAQARKLCEDDSKCAGMFESNANQWHLFSAGTDSSGNHATTTYYNCCAAGCRATYGLSSGYCATNVQTVGHA